MGMEQFNDKEAGVEGEKETQQFGEYGRFKTGDTVRVQRSDGSIEGDWVFVCADPVDGTIHVSREVDGGTQIKKILKHKFDALQGSETDN